MKGLLRFAITTAILCLIMPTGQNAQGTKYCKMLGKTFKDLKTTYGAPAFQNLDEASMQWVFYQMGSDKITFVGNEEKIFQIQGDIICGSKKESEKKMDDFFKECTANHMKIDTLQSGNFKITGGGLAIDLYIRESAAGDIAGFKFKAVAEAKKD